MPADPDLLSSPPSTDAFSDALANAPVAEPVAYTWRCTGCDRRQLLRLRRRHPGPCAYCGGLGMAPVIPGRDLEGR